MPSLPSSSSVLVSLLPMKKELIYCGFVCISSWVSVSYNKVVTDLANQQTVLYLQQPEHRGDLSLTDGCVVCVCVCVCVCTCLFTLCLCRGNECRSFICVFEHIFICLYLHMHMCLHCIFQS